MAGKVAESSSLFFSKDGVQSLDEYERGMFPNAHMLLRIFFVFPTSTACVKRSSSSMKRLKTDLRISVSVYAILEKFALSSAHRLQFTIYGKSLFLKMCAPH